MPKCFLNSFRYRQYSSKYARLEKPDPRVNNSDDGELRFASRKQRQSHARKFHTAGKKQSLNGLSVVTRFHLLSKLTGKDVHHETIQQSSSAPTTQKHTPILCASLLPLNQDVRMQTSLTSSKYKASSKSQKHPANVKTQSASVNLCVRPQSVNAKTDFHASPAKIPGSESGREQNDWSMDSVCRTTCVDDRTADFYRVLPGTHNDIGQTLYIHDAVITESTFTTYMEDADKEANNILSIFPPAVSSKREVTKLSHNIIHKTSQSGKSCIPTLHPNHTPSSLPSPRTAAALVLSSMKRNKMMASNDSIITGIPANPIQDTTGQPSDCCMMGSLCSDLPGADSCAGTILGDAGTSNQDGNIGLRSTSSTLAVHYLSVNDLSDHPYNSMTSSAKEPSSDNTNVWISCDADWIWDHPNGSASRYANTSNDIKAESVLMYNCGILTERNRLPPSKKAVLDNRDRRGKVSRSKKMVHSPTIDRHTNTVNQQPRETLILTGPDCVKRGDINKMTSEFLIDKAATHDIAYSITPSTYSDNVSAGNTSSEQPGSNHTGRAPLVSDTPYSAISNLTFNRLMNNEHSTPVNDICMTVSSSNNTQTSEYKNSLHQPQSSGDDLSTLTEIGLQQRIGGDNRVTGATERKHTALITIHPNRPPAYERRTSREPSSQTKPDCSVLDDNFPSSQTKRDCSGNRLPTNRGCLESTVVQHKENLPTTGEPDRRHDKKSAQKHRIVQTSPSNTTLEVLLRTGNNTGTTDTVHDHQNNEKHNRGHNDIVRCGSDWMSRVANVLLAQGVHVVDNGHIITTQHDSSHIAYMACAVNAQRISPLTNPRSTTNTNDGHEKTARGQIMVAENKKTNPDKKAAGGQVIAEMQNTISAHRKQRTHSSRSSRDLIYCRDVREEAVLWTQQTKPVLSMSSHYTLPHDPVMVKCQECDLHLPTAKDLELHTTSRSGGTKRRKCDSSGVAVNKTVDSDCRNTCSVCSRVFTRSWLLKGHMRTHTGERPFRCTWPDCQRAFADKSNLRSHTLIHTTTGKTFTCLRCNRAFSQKRYLHKHMLEVCRTV